MAKSNKVDPKVFFIIFTLLGALFAIIDGFAHRSFFTGLYEESLTASTRAEALHPTISSILTFFYAFLFTTFYVEKSVERNLNSGLKFGTLFGITAGFLIGITTYIYMPISFDLALNWIILIIVESIVGGAFIGTLANKLKL